MIERVECTYEAGPYRRGARGRQLLAAHDRGKAGKSGLALPQRRHAREFENGLEPRVLRDQRVDRVFEVGLGVEMNGHCGMLSAHWFVMRGLDPRIHLIS